MYEDAFATRGGLHSAICMPPRVWSRVGQAVQLPTTNSRAEAPHVCARVGMYHWHRLMAMVKINCSQRMILCFIGFLVTFLPTSAVHFRDQSDWKVTNLLRTYLKMLY